jgi:hypothetical protein
LPSVLQVIAIVPSAIFVGVSLPSTSSGRPAIRRIQRSQSRMSFVTI